jgi:hypothetical protein
VRGAEVDPAGPGLQDPRRQRGHVLRRAREREPVQHLVRDQDARRLVLARADQGADPVREAGRQLGGRVQAGHHRQVRGDFGTGPPPRRGAVLVHDGDRPEHHPDLVGGPAGRLGADPDPFLDEPNDRGVRAAAHLDLVGDLAGQRGAARSPGTQQQRGQAVRPPAAQPDPGCQPVRLPGVAAVVPGQQRAHDRRGVAQVGQRPALLDADRVQPGAAGQAEVGAAAGGRVERRESAGDLVGMLGVRVEAGRPQPDPRGGPRHLQQRRQRRLVQQVGEHAYHVEAVGLGRRGELGVPAGPLVGLEGDADLGHGIR